MARVPRHPNAPRPGAAPARARRTGARPDIAIAAALALATLVAYGRAVSLPFLDGFDDGAYVVANPHVTGGLTPAGIAWAASAFCAGNWHPVTMLSHMLDCTLFGVASGPAHVVNLLLHVANVLLVFFGLVALTQARWRSAFVAALFALHPVHVESVAWLAERKDVLSTLFLLLTIGAYRRWTRGGGPRAYAAMLLLYALGLMSKPMLVTLPFALVLLDAWPLRRLALAGPPAPGQVSLARSLAEKLPLLALAAGASVVALRAQSAVGATAGSYAVPFSLRAGNAVLAAAHYLGVLFVPVRLACLYPLPRAISPVAVTAAAALLAALTVAALGARRRAPWALVGWLWFLGTLVPVIGLVQVGNQAYADRYTYVPWLGLTVALTWLLADLAAARRVPGTALAAAASLVLVLAAGATWRQVGFWSDPLALFEHCVQVTGPNGVAANNYGAELMKRGRGEEARAQFERALALDPKHLAAWSNLGTVLGASGRPDAAVAAFRRGLAVDPRDVRLRYNLALALAELRRYPESFAQFDSVERATPGDGEVRMSHSQALGEWADSLARTGRRDEAIASYERALATYPGNPDARRGLERVRAAGGR